MPLSEYDQRTLRLLDEALGRVTPTLVAALDEDATLLQDLAGRVNDAAATLVTSPTTGWVYCASCGKRMYAQLSTTGAAIRMHLRPGGGRCDGHTLSNHRLPRRTDRTLS